jgi:uncharacterized protein
VKIKHSNTGTWFKALIIHFMILALFVPVSKAQYADIPEKPLPPRLVNDFSNTLSVSEIQRLENKLVRFNDTTSTQIVIVLVKSLAGYDKAQFADLLGEKWGVGHQGKNNGLVVLVKPKRGNERGEAFIATGYGLEGAVPDAVARRIIDEEMIPEFIQNRYFAGLDKGTNTLMKLTAGEFSAEDYMQRNPAEDAGAILPFLIFIIIAAIMMSRKSKMRGYGGRRSGSLPFWTALFLANGLSGRSSGKWNDFSSGRGAFGGGNFGGGGSFGGFGGGSFGGGGAGGSW